MENGLNKILFNFNKYKNVLKYPVLKSQPVLSEEWKKWWNLVTVDPKDVIETIQMQTYSAVVMNYNVNIPKKFDTTQVELKTFNTHQGKCISVKVRLFLF